MQEHHLFRLSRHGQEFHVYTDTDGVIKVRSGARGSEVDFPTWSVDASNNPTGLVGPDGNTAFWGAMTSGTWMRVSSIFRLRLTGTGNVTVDAKDWAGNITTSVESYSIIGATDQIEYPYLGEDAVAMRVTLTGTATAEVI